MSDEAGITKKHGRTMSKEFSAALAAEDLGKISDCELANRLGIDTVVVGRARRSRHLPRVKKPTGLRPVNSSYPKPAEKYGVTDKLGTMPDQTIASSIGVSREYVRQMRKFSGIAKFVQPKQPKQPKQVKAVRPPPAWWSDPDLGLVPDVVIAAKYGLSQATVQVRRSLLKIKKKWAAGSVRQEIEKSLDLGRIADSAIAVKFGVSRMTVQRVRMKLGIPGILSRRLPQEVTP